MIEQSVRIHDRHQIELKLAYTLGDLDKTRVYDVSLYLFVPPSLGITDATFSKRDFFSSLTTHIRVKTPAFLLRDLASGESSPLGKVESSLTNLARQPDDASILESDRQIRMFCCILKSALRDHVGVLSNRTSVGDQQDVVEEYLGAVAGVISKFRALRPVINVPTVGKDSFSKYLFADEFISLLAESNAYALLEALKKQGNGVFETYRTRLLGFIGSEIAYRTENGYPSVPDGAGDNETLVFRRSVLKKFFESVLFLGVRAEREGTVAEQSIFAFAAGLSMVFATAIAFTFQKTFGNLTFPLFAALVVSYMLKDRIKELLRRFLATKVRRFFFDRRQTIFADPQAGRRIGLCRESFDYVNESRLPANIWRLRNRDHLTEIENGWLGESVAVYRKRVTLLPKWFRQTQGDYPIHGINDILRLNVSDFLRRMDEPRKRLWTSDGQDYHEVGGQRVYHVNLIVECRSGETLNEQRFRVVLNKDGIKRIEPVNAEQTVLRHVVPETGRDLFAEVDAD